jgi:quinoprotein glucose dehydrogenase
MMMSKINWLHKIVPFSCLVFFIACDKKNRNYTGWEVYGGTKENIHYSSLSEIDTVNVQQLTIAWTYNTGDADTVHHSQIQCNPIIINGILYGTTPQMKLFAVDADTGNERWVFNPFDSLVGNKQAFFILNNSRGLAYWSDGDKDARLFYTAGSHVYSIDALTGESIKSFGLDGRIDLHDGLERDVADLFITATSPGVIYKDLIIMGSRVDEGAAAAPGHIRAYDVRTGKQQWIFHTIPQPGEAGYETWDDKEAYKHIGGANVWSGFSLDEQRGIVFGSTGSASFDFYGGKRTGDNLFANSVLALDAATGRRIWHFQTLHHDVWDKDLPTPPALITLHKDGKDIDAVAQTTKTGYVFLFERETGKPVYPIVETSVPHQSGLRGEKLSPTQPVPLLPAPFVRQNFTEADINHLLPDSSYQDIKKRWTSYKKGHQFFPPSKEGTIVFPGFDGGAEWGGPSYDPATGILYVNANEMPWVLTMVDLKESDAKTETYLDAGRRLYNSNCMACHGAKREGSGNNPALTNLNKRYNQDDFLQLVATGRRMMPAFKQLNQEEREAIATYVLEEKERQGQTFKTTKAQDAYRNLPYSITGYNKFLSKEGYPAVKPPWGTLNAIDLGTGKMVWKTVLGEYPEFKSKGITTGTENYGGSVVTAGGVLFIAATRDGKFRAFNKRNGKMLWETDLPVPGFATPSIFEAGGKQYIVIACGGGKLGTPSGDAYIAFSLPSKYP